MRYTDKIYQEARMVAILAHGNQRYDEIYPYEKHLDDVVEVLKRFVFLVSLSLQATCMM
jgi:hypothetical protein